MDFVVFTIEVVENNAVALVWRLRVKPAMTQSKKQ
jgi:hypothetical protein